MVSTVTYLRHWLRRWQRVGCSFLGSSPPEPGSTETPPEEGGEGGREDRKLPQIKGWKTHQYFHLVIIVNNNRGD